MNFRNISILIVLALSLPGLLSAIQITGKVAAISGDTATIAMDGDVLPSVGDKVDVFFKMPGSSAEISVAQGHVYEITGEDIMVEIENATGTVGKDQLVRIDSPNPRKRPADAAPRLHPGTKASQPPATVAAASAPTEAATLSPQPHKQSAPPKPLPGSESGPSKWSDLTNVSQKLIGTWQIGPGRTRFSADGTFFNYGHPGMKPTQGHWEVQGDQLVQHFSSGNTQFTQILSIDAKTEVVKADGKTFRLTKVK